MMKVRREKITVEELLRRYGTGERNFTQVIIQDSREGLLRGIDLSGINLENSIIIFDLSGTILRKNNLSKTIWGECHWRNVDFTGSDFSGINNGVECVFGRCNFSNTIWNQADLFQSTFEDCDLTGADFEKADFSEVDLYG